MTRHGTLLAFLLIAPVLGVTEGCVNSQSSTFEEQPLAVTVISVSATDEDLSECVGKPLQRHIPSLRFVAGEDFSTALFPWFEQSVAPRDEEALSRLLAKPLVRARVESLGVRYVVTVEGQTNRTGGGGCIHLLCFGSWKKATHLSGSILDLQREDLVSNVETQQSGTSWFVLLGIFPLGAPTLTESRACEEFAEAAAKFISSRDTLLP